MGPDRQSLLHCLGTYMFLTWLNNLRTLDTIIIIILKCIIFILGVYLRWAAEYAACSNDSIPRVNTCLCKLTMSATSECRERQDFGMK